MFGKLGDITFEALFSPTAVEGTFATDYAEHALINGKPRLQKVGEKLDEWRLELRLHQRFCQPADSLAQLQTLRKNGEAIPFIMALDYRGWFVISEITVNFTDFNGQGVMLCAEAQITLREYTGSRVKPLDPLAIKVNAPPVPAISTRPPLTLRQVIDGQQPLKQAELALIKQQQAFAKIRKAAAAISAIQNIGNSADKLSAIVTAMPALTGGARLLADSHSLFSKLPSLIALTGTVASSGNSVKSAHDLLANGLTVANIASRLSGASSLLNTAQTVLSDAAPDFSALAGRVAARVGVL